MTVKISPQVAGFMAKTPVKSLTSGSVGKEFLAAFKETQKASLIVAATRQARSAK